MPLCDVGDYVRRHCYHPSMNSHPIIEIASLPRISEDYVSSGPFPSWTLPWRPYRDAAIHTRSVVSADAAAYDHYRHRRAVPNLPPAVTALATLRGRPGVPRFDGLVLVTSSGSPGTDRAVPIAPY